MYLTCAEHRFLITNSGIWGAFISIQNSWSWSLIWVLEIPMPSYPWLNWTEWNWTELECELSDWLNLNCDLLLNWIELFELNCTHVRTVIVNWCRTELWAVGRNTRKGSVCAISPGLLGPNTKYRKWISICEIWNWRERTLNWSRKSLIFKTVYSSVQFSPAEL